MKIVVDIPEEAYKLLKNEGVDWLGAEHILDAVANGTPLPTDAVDRVTIKEYLDSFEVEQPKMGQWIREKLIYGWDGKSYQCSECGRSIHLDTAVEDITDYPYCHCGAKMQEAEE